MSSTDPIGNIGKSQDAFLKLKAICVPLLSLSRVNHKEIPKILSLLRDLATLLDQLKKECIWLKPNLLSYVLFPLSTILSRNDVSNIPDQVLEGILIVLEHLFSWWWWTCDVAIWEQMLMLAGSIVGGLDLKGKNRERDDETKTAAVKVIICLLKSRSSDDSLIMNAEEDVKKALDAKVRMDLLQSHAQKPKLVPVLGQIFNSLLLLATSEHLPLQLYSLEAAEIIVLLYVPDGVIPSILPGIVSASTRIAIGRASNVTKGKGWVNGSVVSAALRLLDVGIVRAIGDGPCKDAGLVKELNDLEDLTELMSKDAAVSSSSQPEPSKKSYETIRTPSWLRATSSQIHIALKSLSCLLSHPTPSSLIGLSSLSSSLLSNARLTLPDSSALLLSYLLSLSVHKFPSVSDHSRNALQVLLNPSARASTTLRQTLYHHIADCLTSLPFAISSRSDAKIIHLSKQIEASCSLPNANVGVGRLLGPTGHIEKWGFRLLAVLSFAEPTSIYSNGNINLLLENGPTDQIVFPPIILRDVGTREPHESLEQMLRKMGHAGGETCLFAVEWFVRTGITDRRSSTSVAALWCACRILEGSIGICLGNTGDVDRNSNYQSMSKRFEKLARWMASAISELWDKREENSVEAASRAPQKEDFDDLPVIEFTKGLTPLQTRFDLLSASEKLPLKQEYQCDLHTCFSLQLLAVCAEVLRSRFTPLLMYALYPVLHSLVQPSVYVNGSAFASLQHMTRSLGFASPGNLLLANFDYALDGAARRLTRRNLDVDAAHVLSLLVRLVGRDIVSRASDVVEECFNRLDDFHGYTIVVEGLVEVLHEVVTVIADIEEPLLDEDNIPDEKKLITDRQHFENFLDWLTHRNVPSSQMEEADEIGPSPRKAFGDDEDHEGDKKGTSRHDQSSTLDEPSPTPTQALVSQIVTRSITLLIHGSILVRVRILTLLSNAVPTLPASALLPSVHRAWPFILNRLGDSQTAVVAATASLIAALASTHGSFMTQRIWDDVWPRFKQMLSNLDAADSKSALARRSTNMGVGTESAYTHSHRLYRAMVQTMTSAIRGGVQIQDRRSWDVLVSFRRFLSREAHSELQAAARELYITIGEKNEDTVWLVLTSSAEVPGVPHLKHLVQKRWDIKDNVMFIIQNISNPK